MILMCLITATQNQSLTQVFAESDFQKRGADNWKSSLRFRQHIILLRAGTLNVGKETFFVEVTSKEYEILFM